VRAEKTHATNNRCVKHFKSAFGARPLVDMTADSIELYLRDRLRHRVRIKTSEGYKETTLLKSTTVRQEFRVLRRMLNVAVRKKFLLCNPCAGVEFPVSVKGLFRPLWLAKILLGFEIKSLRRFVSSRCDVTPERCSISCGSVWAPLPVCFALVAASC
jgi:hypothetical protein